MQLSDILENFLSMTQDAVGISYLAPNDDCPRVVHVNPSYCDLFGQTATDVIGKPVYSIHDPETWDQISVQVGQLLRQHTNKIQVDSRCLRADGTKFWASISLFTIPDTKTGGLYTCATFRDISDLKDREKTAVNAVKDRDLLLSKQEVINTQLMVSQTRLVSAINAYPDPFAIYDKDMRLVISNAAYKKSMAVDPRSVRIGMTMHDVLNVAFDDGKIIVPPQDRQAYYDRIKHLKRTEHSVEDIEFSDGTHHRILRSVAENGDLVIIRLDVSELVHQRRQSTALYDRTIAALNAYPDPFAIYDADTRLVMWNDAFTTLVTDTPDDLAVGMTNAQVEALAARSGRIIASHATGTQEEPQGSDTALCPSAPTDLELPGDVHRRVLRSQAPNGDFVVIQMDTTELVQQRRAAEALQERLLAAISAYPAPFCIYDKAHRLAVWNDSYTAALTDDPSELRVGMSVEDVLRTGLKNQRFPQAKGREETWLQTTLEATLSLQPVEDIELPNDQHFRLLRSKSRNGDLIFVRLDTTQLVRQKRTLQETQDRLISAINAFPDPFSIYDPDLQLAIWNPAFANSITDTPEDIYVGMSVRDVLKLSIQQGQIPAARGREDAWLNAYARPSIVDTLEEDFEMANDTHYRIVRSRSENGELLVLRLNVTESVRQRRALETYASQLEDANQQITFKALHDQLTGLGNRRYLSEKFDALSELRRKTGGELAALHIDLDRFKQINDTIGHSAGDHVLMDVAHRIQSKVRGDDVVARIGGDEFVVLLHIPENGDRPEQLAEALLADLIKPSTFEGRECRFGASIGIARTPLANESDLLINSDVALYKAKRAGRSQVAIFDTSDIEDMRSTKRLADDIIRGLEHHEFIPYYQPQVDAKTGRVVGIEALARWRHPTNGVLSPDQFLGVASDLNVVSDIDRVIFETAISECEHAFSGVDGYPSLSFNVSANRIQIDGISDIGRLAANYSGHVAFELLETIFLEEESDAFMMQLDQLREMGISLEVDDFGSGRASIVALQRIAPDQLKIDRRLITPMAQGNNATRLVKSIIEIGHALDIGIIAEGVETAEHARILSHLGAQRLQGYYFSRPLNLPTLVQYVKENRKSRQRS